MNDRCICSYNLTGFNPDLSEYARGSMRSYACQLENE